MSGLGASIAKKRDFNKVKPLLKGMPEMKAAETKKKIKGKTKVGTEKWVADFELLSI
jgi:hypothetical protein